MSNELKAYNYYPGRLALRPVRCYKAEDADRELRLLQDRAQALPDMGWHAYTGCGDAPKEMAHQVDVYLCMVQRYAKDTGEAVGAVDYRVLPCDDDGLFRGLPMDDLVDYKVIAWKAITGRKYEAVALEHAQWAFLARKAQASMLRGIGVESAG